MIAGIIQSPSYLSTPTSGLRGVMERRNVVLESMVETGAITREQCDRAKATPLKLSPPNVEASDAPYFVDLVKDSLSSQYSEAELNDNAYHIYTTLDPELQHAAAEAVAEGIKLVDEQVAKQRTRRKKVGKGKDATIEKSVTRPDAAGRSCGAGPAQRRGAGPGRRQKLWLQPAESRDRQAADRLHLQAVCLCGGDEHGS